MRITLDANILVRANTRSRGPARELLELIGSNSDHVLILSRHILEEVKRTLLYPRLQERYGLTKQEIEEHVEDLQRVSTVIEPVITQPVVRNDPDDDPVIYTAIDGRAEVLCTLDGDFYSRDVVEFCRQRGIEIMTDAALLRHIRRSRENPGV